MALDLSSVTSVVSDVAPLAISAIVAVVAANAAVEACKWAYSEVMCMLGRDGYSGGNGGWVQDESGAWHNPDGETYADSAVQDEIDYYRSLND